MIKEKILVIDDEVGIRSSLKGILEDENYVVKTAETGEEGLILLRGENFDLILLDIWLPEMNGIDVLDKIKSSEENIQVIMITGHGSIETAVKATKLGAYDFLEKPLTLEKVVVTVKNALKQKNLEEENIQLRKKTVTKYRLIGKSPSIKKLAAEIKTVAPTDSRVLIYGENGTGKELVARLLHQNSSRKNKRFIQINTAAIPDDFIESDLFGSLSVSFPQLEKNKKGKFALADGGTLFLDEIGEMNLKTQDKLLRYINEQKFEPLGSEISISSDVRLIASTNKNLKALINEGSFREDLYYKLNVIPLVLTPLREKKEDIPLLINYFLKSFSAEYGKKQKSMSKDVMEAFVNYSWPGNISELINVIDRFVIMVPEEEINVSHISLLVEPRESQSTSGLNLDKSLEEAGQQFEKEYIHRALSKNKWDIIKAASVLSIKKDLLQEKVKQLGISFLG